MNNTKRMLVLRQRALRAAYGGLLLSPLSELELKTLANELDFTFIEELRRLLLQFPSHEHAELYEEDGFEKGYRTENELIKLIYDRCKSRRLSKDKVLTFMREIDFEIARKLTRQPLTLGDYVREFVLAAGPAGSNRLLQKVAGSPEQDPYLIGITSRK